MNYVAYLLKAKSRLDSFNVVVLTYHNYFKIDSDNFKLIYYRLSLNKMVYNVLY